MRSGGPGSIRSMWWRYTTNEEWNDVVERDPEVDSGKNFKRCFFYVGSVSERGLGQTRCAHTRPTEESPSACVFQYVTQTNNNAKR